MDTTRQLKLGIVETVEECCLGLGPLSTTSLEFFNVINVKNYEKE